MVNSATVDTLTGPPPGGPPPEWPPPEIATYCEAKDAFTKDYARLVVVHFGDDEDICNADGPPTP